MRIHEFRVPLTLLNLPTVGRKEDCAQVIHDAGCEKRVLRRVPLHALAIVKTVTSHEKDLFDVGSRCVQTWFLLYQTDPIFPLVKLPTVSIMEAEPIGRANLKMASEYSVVSHPGE